MKNLKLIGNLVGMVLLIALIANTKSIAMQNPLWLVIVCYLISLGYLSLLNLDLIKQTISKWKSK